MSVIRFHVSIPGVFKVFIVGSKEASQKTDIKEVTKESIYSKVIVHKAVQ